MVGRACSPLCSQQQERCLAQSNPAWVKEGTAAVLTQFSWSPHTILLEASVVGDGKVIPEDPLPSAVPDFV